MPDEPAPMTQTRFPAVSRVAASTGGESSPRGSGAAAGAAAPRQAHDPLGVVVALVRLPYPVFRVGAVHVGKAAAQSGHVDPLLVVLRRVDVRPAHGCAERDMPLT